MSERVLITGNGKSGSYKIRAEQLGAAIGATVIPKATDAAGFDLAVTVKRIDTRFVERLRVLRIPLVYDIVDAWPQPHGNTWDRDECMRWLKAHLGPVKPYAIVAATQAMAEDISSLGYPQVLALPHHARPGQAINPIRPEVKTIGYEGGVAYLGKWKTILETECARRGWRFVVNPLQLADLDIVVALREANGYAARNWKSNVKLANAQGSGTPIICGPESGYTETACGAETWADSKSELRIAFDFLTPFEARKRAAQDLRTAPVALETIAAQYRNWLETL